MHGLLTLITWFLKSLSIKIQQYTKHWFFYHTDHTFHYENII